MEIDPKIFQSARLLEMYARRIVHGFLSGGNKSLRSGTGMQFKQYRNYQPGDDIRQLDWKMYARSGKYFIKESEIDTDVTIRIVIDASASMLYQENGYSKLDYAKLLTIILTFVAINQGDRVNVEYINSDAGIQRFQTIRSQKDVQNLISTMDNLEAKDNWPPLKSIMHKIPVKRKQITILISDLYETNNEIINAIKSLNSVSSEMMVFHLLFDREYKFDYQGNLVFEDLESGHRIETHAPSISDKVKESIDTHFKEIKRVLYSKSIFYYLMFADQPVEEALTQFLKHRDKLR